ncbi:hypothetical protein K435DRAFT_862150 [Dendrothele bispora CBS 962.96]|uniref:Uncharacterized protein n=1 Tax=Dendrothele bispora (strain CBS 962.96) TaxID=1314807 RepID=A0A4S8LTE2_DENBC|nr:hypothetical protein K435DRAFT_862150 [Dendrothele bispora CBS 962.96]
MGWRGWKTGAGLSGSPNPSINADPSIITKQGFPAHKSPGGGSKVNLGDK